VREGRTDLPHKGERISRIREERSPETGNNKRDDKGGEQAPPPAVNKLKMNYQLKLTGLFTARFLSLFGMTTTIRGIKRRLFGGFAAKQPIPGFLEERASFRTK
jgi:hypothetical protein